MISCKDTTPDKGREATVLGSTLPSKSSIVRVDTELRQKGSIGTTDTPKFLFFWFSFPQFVALGASCIDYVLMAATIKSW